jgi:A/G-specific adenine glycosylase
MLSAKPSRGSTGREALLRWYRPRRPAYPWRRGSDPYGTLVSEVMLQQTQASRVALAYPPFMERFPDVRSLATASRADVIRAWEGLGYNRRAVSLSEAARAIARDHAERIPETPEALLRLPGVGPYTAAAVASIAFGARVAAVDTNVRRVVARVHLAVEPQGVSAREIAALADSWLDRRDPGRWNSALMDLGRDVCRPAPRCEICPIARVCLFSRSGATPQRSPRRQGSFEGSTRQVRGAVIRALRAHPTRTLAGLVLETGFELERVTSAVAGLSMDGLLEVGPAAAAGRPAGRVRLAS